jgi:heptaprenyl diphosphate synthase
VLHALRAPTETDGRLTELLGSADLTDPRLHAEALSLLRAHPAMEAARTDLRHWAGVARAEIAGLPDAPARTAFEALCDYVIRRTG